ncbi:hypothetical protein T492DRAFT_845338 [Pavlovales sp. CCMP2436]|nr:hypothetical protein T492DRAFT_845338 [Pavlovales sp. CCMP2436]
MWPRLAMWLPLALLVAHGFVLPPPPRIAVLSRWPHTAAFLSASPASRVVASAALPPEPESGFPPGGGAGGASVTIDGNVVCAGSDVIVGDEHGSWWTAVVVDVRRASGDVDILVHYNGCDPASDEWLAADSGRVVPSPRASADTSEETWRDVGEGLDPVTDAELLEQLRDERQAVIDQWQYNTLCAAHSGEWAGSLTRYDTSGRDGAGPRLEVGEALFAVSSAVRPVGDLAATRTVTLSESAAASSPDPAGPEGTARLARSPLCLAPREMRATFGHMAVGSAYTCAHSPTTAERVSGSEGVPLVIEIAVSHSLGVAAAASPAAAQLQRVRCTFGYSALVDVGQAPGAGAGRARKIEWVEISRETVLALQSSSSAELPSWATSLAGEAGKGLYDPEAQRGASGLYSLYCPGGLTIVLPTQLREGVSAAVSVDWDAGGMRYQADRKFGGSHDGSLLALELTEAEGSDQRD